MKQLFLVLAAMLLVHNQLPAQSTPDCIIPQVESYSLSKGSFTLSPGSTFYIKTKISEGSGAFSDYLGACPLGLVKAPGKKADIVFTIDSKQLKGKPEGAYQLNITPKGITVKAAGYEGAFYALQSLLQMCNACPGGALAACRIDDAPRFPYRGLMFDVVRHFHSKDFILKQLDLMALLKMNRLHMHLTDNEAWRIELDCAPEMAQSGAFGSSKFFNTILGGLPHGFTRTPAGYVHGTVYDDGTVYGGYYSKDDIREIIAYAAERHIVIVPEIELPGHNAVLLHVHPEFFCEGAHKVNNVVCAGNEKVFDFFEKVLEEVMDLFPGTYIHIGGDEASKSNWLLCPRCHERMAAEGLGDEFQLQSYIIRRVEAFINKHGKRLIGWDEILEGGLSEGATVMSWRGTKGGIESLRQHHDVIMTPNTYYYFDYGQDAPYKEPIAFNAYLPLKTVYGYDPEEEIRSSAGPDVDCSHLLGVQANLWSECIISDDHYEYMLYPRAFAVAETGWSPAGSKDYAAFRAKALKLSEWIRQQGYCPFDLANEAGDRPEAGVPVPRITDNIKATWSLDGGPSEDASILVDGLRGGWNINDAKAWKEARKKEMVVDIDLGSVQDIHYVGAEFIDYGTRRIMVPQDTEFSISEDGKVYTPLKVPQARLAQGRRYFQICTVGSPVSVKGRYLRLRFNSGPDKVRARVGEIMIN